MCMLNFRPNIHLPIKLVLHLVALVEWVRGKLHLRRTCNPFLTPVTAHVFSCTRTFDSSKAQRIIRYSPVTSLEVSNLACLSIFVVAVHKHCSKNRINRPINRPINPIRWQPA